MNQAFSAYNHCLRGVLLSIFAIFYVNFSNYAEKPMCFLSFLNMSFCQPNTSVIVGRAQLRAYIIYNV